MKKIINGKRYDTETATQVAQWDNGRYDNDFNAIEESLYLTKNGAWFVAGSGGPHTKYGVACGSNSWSGGSGITVLDTEQAKDWLEKHDCVVALEQYFGSEIVDA